MNFSNARQIEQLAARNDREGLYRFLEHPNKVTRFEAAVALAELEDGRGWRFLLDAVRQAQDPESQEVAAAILSDLGHIRAIPALAEALQRARGETAEVLKEALQTIGGAEAEEALRQAGYEPIAPRMTGSQQIMDFDAGMVREPRMDTTEIKIHTAEQHFDTAADLREAELTERGLVENALALWLAPDWAYAWYLRGVLFEDLDRYFEAWLSYRHSLQIDPTQSEVRVALNDLEAEQDLPLLEADVLVNDLTARGWITRRDAAAGLGALSPQVPEGSVDLLIELLFDEDREVRHAAIEAVGKLGDQRAVETLLVMNESSWLLRFGIIEALANLGSIAGVEAALRKEMHDIHERNPIFSRQKDPLLELEFDLLMEVGVLAFEKTGDLQGLLALAEDNVWEAVEEGGGTDPYAVDYYEDPYGGGPFEEDEEEVEDDLESYVDEVAQMASLALERLAVPQLPQLDKNTLNRIAAVPDLTLIDVSDESSQPFMVHDLSELRQAARAELERRQSSTP
jgi:HEAT repeat protein